MWTFRVTELCSGYRPRQRGGFMSHSLSRQRAVSCWIWWSCTELLRCSWKPSWHVTDASNTPLLIRCLINLDSTDGHSLQPSPTAALYNDTFIFLFVLFAFCFLKYILEVATIVFCSFRFSPISLSYFVTVLMVSSFSVLSDGNQLHVA